MAKLNPQQERAVRHRTGPLLILAGAGTGKTRVVTERMAHLLRQGVKAVNMLGVTFTNKAAGEMRTRLASLAGKRVDLKELIISTFHSLAVRIIRRDARALGYSPGFSICDRGEQMALIRKAVSTVKGNTALSLEGALARIGSLKNNGMEYEEFARSAVDEDENILAAIYRRYQQALRRQNCLDFDDLLLQAHRLLDICPGALEYWRERFQYIMVDEFQDTNQVQFSLVRKLAGPRDNLCVVGDDDQSIYAWRGAMAGNILKFRESYPNVTTVALEQNYRSTSTILSAANAVIRNNSGRNEKNLWSDLGQGRVIRLTPYNDQFEEADGVVARIVEQVRGGSGGSTRHFSDFSVIVRANAQSKVLEDAFVASRVPFEVIGGQSIFDRKEARDVLSFLAVIANPGADNQLLRIINVPPRGIGGKSVDALAAHANRAGMPLGKVLSDPDQVEGLAKPAAAACRKFHEQIEGWRRRLKMDGFGGLVKAILDESNYQEEIAGLYHNPLDAASRWNEAMEVEDSLRTFAERNPDLPPGRIVEDFLCEAVLAGKSEGGKKKTHRDAVCIITAHSAKGLEYPFVFLPGLEENLFPHKNALEEGGVEEERRLFYVAMTRAKLELNLSYCRGRQVRGKEQKCEASRFLAEIPGEFLLSDATPTREEEALDWISQMREKLKNTGR